MPGKPCGVCPSVSVLNCLSHYQHGCSGGSAEPHLLYTVPNVPLPGQGLCHRLWKLLGQFWLNCVRQRFVPMLSTLSPWRIERSQKGTHYRRSHMICCVILSESHPPCVCSLICELRGLNWMTFMVLLGSEPSSHPTILPPPLQVGAQSARLLVFIINSWR